MIRTRSTEQWKSLHELPTVYSCLYLSLDLMISGPVHMHRCFEWASVPELLISLFQPNLHNYPPFTAKAQLKTPKKIRERLLSCCWFLNVHSGGVWLCCGDFLLNVCSPYTASDICASDLCHALKLNSPLAHELLLWNKWWGNDVHLRWTDSVPLKKHTYCFQPQCIHTDEQKEHLSVSTFQSQAERQLIEPGGGE